MGCEFLKKKIVLTLAMLSVLFVSAVVTVSQAADYNRIGVKTGNRADYSSMGYYPRFGALLNNVTGTFANFTLTSYYLNGTIGHTNYYYGNVTNGDIYVMLIPANLTAGDPVYPGSDYIINRTDVMNVAGAQRYVNNYTWYSSSGWSHIYWDKFTGILVEVRAHLSANETMISTNMWKPSPSSSSPSLMTLLLVGGALVLLVGAAVALALRRRGK